jgi:hypothetical protein
MGIDIVALDWNRPDWGETYFPPDLPQDWRLAYFATQFEAVLVPAAAWEATPLEVLTQWAEEVPAHFRFYRETRPGCAPAVLYRASSALGDRYTGRITASPSAQVSGDSDATTPSLSNPLYSAIDAQGMPILARQIPDRALADPGLTLTWLHMLAAEAGPRTAVAIFAEGDPDALSQIVQLAQLAGLA